MQTLMQSAFLQSLGWALVQSAWQITLLWGIYFIGSRLFLKQNHRARVALAMLTLLAGFSWFVVTIILRMNLPASANRTIFSLPDGLVAAVLPYLSSAYLLLLAAGAWRFARSIGYVRHLRSEKHEKAGFEWRLFTREHAALIGIKRKVTIWLSELADSPVTIGFLKPMILVPVSMVNQLSTEQMEAVILHELAHIKRHDYLLNMLLAVMEGLLFFHPLVHLLGKEIRKDREFLCDDLVLQFRYKPALYAAALLQAEKNRILLQHNRLRLAAIGEKEALMERVSRIAGVPVHKRSGFHPALLLVFLVAAGAFLLTPPSVKRQGLAANANGSVIREFAEYPMAVASWMPERSGPMINMETTRPRETSLPPDAAKSGTEAGTKIETEETLPAGSEVYIEAVTTVPDANIIPVADREYTLVVDGERLTGKISMAPAAAVAAAVPEKKPFTITLTHDSTALLLYNLDEGEYRKALDLGKLSAFLNKLDWEKIAHEQAKGVESIQLMQQEITKALQDVQWEQFRASAEKMALEAKAAALHSLRVADSLRAEARKKEQKIIIRL